MCQHPTLTVSRADGVTRSNERLGDEAQAPNDTPATHPKPQRFQTVILVTQTILFYNVGERREARCAEKTKTEANAKPNKRVVMFAGYA